MKQAPLIIFFILMVLTLFLNTFLPAAAFAKTTSVKTDPDHLSLSAGICVNKARNLFQKGLIQDAINLLDEFINRSNAKNPPDKIHHYLYFLMGNYYSVLAQNNVHTDNSNPKSPQKALSEKAFKAYRNALKINPAFSAAWLNLARHYYETEQFETAARAFEKGYEYSSPKKAVHLYYAAVCRFQSGSRENALTLFNSLLKNHPKDISLSWKEMLVHILFSMDQYKKALPYIEELAHKTPYPKNKKWQETLLYQYINLEMDKKALAYAIELTRTDTLEPKWWKGLSHIYLKNDEQKQGLTALIIYGFLTPMTKEELELAADLYFSLDIPRKAADYYQATLKKNHNTRTLEKLAQAFAMAHDPDNAIKSIDTQISTQLVSDENKKRHARLIKLRQQLVQMQQFFAKANDVLQPSQSKN